MYRQTPNLITVARLALVVPFVVLLAKSTGSPSLRPLAVGVFALLACTDWVDGYVARRFDLCTTLGRVLDPAADKLVALVAFLAMALVSTGEMYYHVPDWLVVLVVGKDVWLVSGYLVIRLFQIRLTIHPSVWGKLGTLSQFAFVGVALLTIEMRQLGLPWLPGAVMWVATVATAIAGIDYTRVGAVRMANAQLVSPGAQT